MDTLGNYLGACVSGSATMWRLALPTTSLRRLRTSSAVTRQGCVDFQKRGTRLDVIPPMVFYRSAPGCPHSFIPGGRRQLLTCQTLRRASLPYILMPEGTPISIMSTPFSSSLFVGILFRRISSALCVMYGSFIIEATATTSSPLV